MNEVTEETRGPEIRGPSWGGGCSSLAVFVIFLIAVTKSMTRDNWGKEEFVLAHSLRIYTMVRKA